MKQTRQLNHQIKQNKMHSTTSPSPFIFFFFFILIFLTFTTIAPTTFPQEALPSKSGYFTVNSTTGSSIFYAFYEAHTPTSPISQTPLLFWLQGGPGCSSMFGNFYELGPWRVTHDIKLEPNNGAWNRLFGLVFLDNPIGAGFSIASTPDEIPREQHSVAKHLFTAITSFIQLEHSFKSRPIYITGESYAGKYVPSIGYHIVRKNTQLPESKRVNLAGLAIGNGLTDPEIQVKTHAVNAYFTGLINERQRIQLEEAQDEAVRQVEAKNWSGATDARNKVLDMLQRMTGLATLYDLRRQKPYEGELVKKFLGRVENKKALRANVSIVWEECSDVVDAALHQDVMKSVRYMVEYLLAKQTKLLLYQGQCDMRDGVVSVEAWMKKMKWEGKAALDAAERKVWRVKGKLAGSVQKWGKLSHVVVLGAGHMVPTDQAVNSRAMIEDWVLERGLFGNSTSTKASL